jgi:fatty-acyl-CoA synthase
MADRTRERQEMKTKGLLSRRFESNDWYHRTVQQLFRETCAARGDKTALVYHDRKISFAELQEQTDRLTWSLMKLGIGPGDRVAVLPTATPDFTYLYFAVLQAGAWFNALNLLWGEIELAGILPRNDPRLIVTIGENAGRNYIDLLRNAVPDAEWDADGVRAASVPSLRHVVSVGQEAAPGGGILDFDDLMKTGDGFDSRKIGARVASSQCTDIQFICQTSGSTGLSKSALWDHRSPLSSAHFVARSLLLGESDSYLNISPYYHNSGIVGAITMNLAYAGTTVHLMDNFRPEAAFDIMGKYAPNVSFGFDAHWQALQKTQKEKGGVFTVNKALVAVTPNNYEMLKYDLMGGVGLITSLYAQTENGPMISATEPDCVDENLRKYANGRPLAGVQLIVKDIDTRKIVPPGELGEICYKSPYLFRGYYKQEEATKKGFDENGYFHSGDYGTFEDGYIRFFGRLGGVVKSGGENVSITYVNSLLLRIFEEDFEDAQTVALPDAYWGARLVTWVRLRAGKTLRSMEDIKAACKGKMAAYEIPKDFLLWEGPWPVNQIGKLEVKVLEEEAKQRLEG